jgi:hypothetical protein
MTTDPTDREAIRDEAGNTIWIRRKMGWGVRNRVNSAATQIGGTGGDMSSSVDIGAYRNALLLVNILAWDGPDLGGKPITQESLDDLDPELGERVYDRIGELNPAPKAAQKKESTNGIGHGSPAAEPGLRVRRTSR